VNARRVAAALRLLADAIEDDEASPIVPAYPASPVKRRRRRGVRVIDVPPVVDEVTAKRAEMALRRAGVYKVTP